MPRQRPLADILTDFETMTATPEETVSAVAVRMMIQQTPRLPVIDPQTRKLIGARRICGQFLALLLGFELPPLATDGRPSLPKPAIATH